MVTGILLRALMALSIVFSLPMLAAPAAAQEKPRYGGELIFVVPAEPPSYDGHREGTFAMVHPVAPHYNTLLRTDPTDRTGTKIIGDLATTGSSCRPPASRPSARRSTPTSRRSRSPTPTRSSSV